MATRRTLYILDEPTTGLHAADIEKLLEVLSGSWTRATPCSVIEHNLDVIKQKPTGSSTSAPRARPAAR